jgi:hypothetical protein
MKKIIAGFVFCGIGLFSFGQVKSVNPAEKPKEVVINPAAKSMSESQNKPASRAKISRKVKPVLRRENYEAAPQKD